MDFEKLLQIVGEEGIFETGLLLVGKEEPGEIRRKLSRWVKRGKIYKLRRGLYALTPTYQKIKPHPFVVANRIVKPSYVSLQSALAFYGLIPETVYMVTSVTTARPGNWKTPFGVYEYRHIKKNLFFGYNLVDLGEGQRAFVALPEKALLDLIYIQPRGDTPDYLNELRLQNLDRINPETLQQFINRVGQPKLKRGAKLLLKLREDEIKGYGG